MTTRFPYRAGLFCLVTVAALTAGCSSRGDKADRPDNPFRTGNDNPTNSRTPLSEAELRLEADKAYRRAHESLNTLEYDTAITRFTALIAKYPFSDYATQAELEKIYAQYRSFQSDEAVIAADRFLREHPRHPNADYVQYVKGLVDFSRDNGGIIDYLPLDSSKRDVTNGRRAYDDFALLLQKFPTSRYVGDSRKRMIYLRNRIAAHELSVTRYYIKRGAWVAAAKRAESIIAEYPGAPATADALLLLQDCYTRLGQKQQSVEVAELIALNTASLQAAKQTTVKASKRSVVEAPVTGAAATATPVAAVEATPPPKGFFGRAAGLLDGLNKTYTIPSAEAAGAANAAPAAVVPTTAPASVNASRGEPDFAAPASLSTGPYSGPDAKLTIPTATDNRAPVEAEGNPQPIPPKTADGSDKPKEKAGWFDFLNKTYTIGGSSKAAATPAATAPAPAAVAPAAATSAPVVVDKAADSATAAPSVAAPAAAAEAPKEKAGLFDFLNKTYVIGGSSKAKPADAATPAPAAAAKSSGNGIRVYIDEDEDEKKKSEAEAAAKAAAAEPAK